jgi:hypothetical protein
MKFILVPILMLLVLAQTFSKWLIVVEYRINRDYISKNLCENKTRPKLHCNGKCQMMKKMAEEEKQNSAGSTVKLKVQDIVLFHEWISLPESYFASAKNNYRFLSEKAYTSPLSSIDHPPANA